LTKSSKFAPQKNHCWHYVKNSLYLWIFFPFKNSKSSTTNYHFKLGEFFGICMCIYTYISHLHGIVFWGIGSFKGCTRVFYMVKLILASSLDKCENLYNKSNGVLYLMYLFIWVIQTDLLPFISPLFFEYDFFFGPITHLSNNMHLN
jgi:hypothetical protein